MRGTCLPTRKDAAFAAPLHTHICLPDTTLLLYVALSRRHQAHQIQQQAPHLQCVEIPELPCGTVTFSPFVFPPTVKAAPYFLHNWHVQIEERAALLRNALIGKTKKSKVLRFPAKGGRGAINKDTLKRAFENRERNPTTHHQHWPRRAIGTRGWVIHSTIHAYYVATRKNVGQTRPGARYQE